MTTQDIENLHTCKSWYDMDTIIAEAEGEFYRIKMFDLLQMLDYIPLIKKKARKHTYLKIDAEKFNQMQRTLETEGEI